MLWTIFATLCVFNYSSWFMEHSIPELSNTDQKLIDEEFPLQARWEKWIREEKKQA